MCLAVKEMKSLSKGLFCMKQSSPGHVAVLERSGGLVKASARTPGDCLPKCEASLATNRALLTPDPTRGCRRRGGIRPEAKFMFGWDCFRTQPGSSSLPSQHDPPADAPCCCLWSLAFIPPSASPVQAGEQHPALRAALGSAGWAAPTAAGCHRERESC